MKKRSSNLFLVCTFLQVSCMTAIARDAFIRAGSETGVATLRTNLGECYAITAGHVIGNEVTASLVLEGGREASARLVRKYTDPDIAVLKVDGNAASVCANASWRQIFVLGSLLEKNQTGWIVSRRQAGGLERAEVTIKTYTLESIEVQMRDPSRRFEKGMSGSALEIDGALAGVVITGSGTTARVARADRIDAVVSSVLPMMTVPSDAQQVWAVDVTHDAAINIINTNTKEDICTNVFTFDPVGHMISCCSCMTPANNLRSFSARLDLLSNLNTPGVPTSIVIKLVSSKPAGRVCNAGAISPISLSRGMRVSGKAGGNSMETVFSSADLSPSDLTQLTSTCDYIQTHDGGFGMCKACRIGAFVPK